MVGGVVGTGGSGVGGVDVGGRAVTDAVGERTVSATVGVTPGGGLTVKRTMVKPTASPIMATTTAIPIKVGVI